MMETQSTTIHLLSVAASASNMTTGFMFEEDEDCLLYTSDAADE